MRVVGRDPCGERRAGPPGQQHDRALGPAEERRLERSMCANRRAVARSPTMTAKGLSWRALRRRSVATAPVEVASQARW